VNQISSQNFENSGVNSLVNKELCILASCCFKFKQEKFSFNGLRVKILPVIVGQICCNDSLCKLR